MRGKITMRWILVSLLILGVGSFGVAAEDTSPPSAEAAGPAEFPPPDDVAAPPDDAERTESGLASKLLRKGEGDRPPGPRDRVTMRYTGWTTDGELFDTTETSGKTRTFFVNGVIDGFAEGVQLMVTGEKRRLWVPAGLAYEGYPERPQGMLVFDIELLSIDRVPEAPVNASEVPKDAIRTESGLAYEVLQRGSGDRHPGPESHVVAHYTVWKKDGTFIDSSIFRGKEATFILDEDTIPAFHEAFQLMVPGQKLRLWAPEELINLREPARYEGLHVIEVELLRFIDKPQTPSDVSAPPTDAVRTDTGLAYTVLQSGTGTRQPKANETVKVVYAGWTADGTIFDSAYDHGMPGSFQLNDKMPLGWNEALRMMVVGEKRRIWIPEELAYAGRDDRPQGMLIFDVELIGIE